WSPDGARIAYNCYSGGVRHVCQMTPTGASKSVTTAGKGLTTAGEPSWSPDSANLTFPGATRAVAGAQIFRIGRTGASLRSLRTFPSADDAPIAAWSPDGTPI